MSMIGLVLMLVGALWMVVIAFQESVLWGLGCLFIPFVTLFYAATRWAKVKVPALIWAAGWLLIFFTRH